MQQALRLVIAAFAAIALTQFSASASAQSDNKQVKLTEKQVVSFIAAQKDMESVTEKQEGDVSDKPDPKIQAQFETIAKKHGFATYSEYDDVAATIYNIMLGIDPTTRAFTDPRIVINREIDEIKADKAIPDADRKILLDERNLALKAAEQVQHPSNVELIVKYYDKLDAMLP